MTVYTPPQGESYFALALQAENLPPAKSSTRDHVILIDTSASQIGEHRKQSFEVLQSFLKSLPADHRVSLIAADVGTKELTKGFVSPNGEAIQSAYAELQRRVPLGATDLHQALHTALNRLDGSQGGSILYIGDGMSTANLIQSAQLQELLKKLLESKIPVHSYAVGARTDLHLLGILAQRTGGVVEIDRRSADYDTSLIAGRKLAKAVNAPVFYPASIKMLPGQKSLLPNLALPLREDRETIYLGRGVLKGDVSVSVTGTLNGEERSFRWQIESKNFQQGKPFLKALFKRAEADHGLSVSLAGADLMEAARAEFDGNIAQLVWLGEQAVVRHNADQAEAIVRLIRKNDPTNTRAVGLLEAAERLRGRTLAQAGSAPPIPNGGSDKNENANPLQARENPPEQPRSLLEAENKRRQIIAQKLTLDVSRAIEQASAISSTDPDTALLALKEALGTVLSTTDVEPAVRQQLIKRVRNAMQDVSNKKEVNDMALVRATKRKALADAKLRMVEEIQIEENKLQDLIDQVRAAITRGEHGDDDAYEEAEAIARVAIDMRPGNGPATAAVFNSEAAGQINKAYRMRSLRADKFLAVLYQVELSHVPFPDEPPILWPPAPVWNVLSKRREKWKAVDLHRESPSEQRIRAALDGPTELDLVDMPLNEVIDHIRELHGINIMLDTKVLEEEKIDTGEIVNFQLSGIKLRSALKI
ncbi:MAG: VWA domain-containing protein, partial [Planctomycetes bacterium]|nr:VWA domain-containing protein [Planctomycetota bacterium]